MSSSLIVSLEISQLLVVGLGLSLQLSLQRYDLLWGLRSAPIIWAQIAFAGYTAHLLRMANCDEDATAAQAAFNDATAVIFNLRRLGPPFGSTLQFADTMAKALQEWEPASPTDVAQSGPAGDVVRSDNLASGTFSGAPGDNAVPFFNTEVAGQSQLLRSWPLDPAPSLTTAPIYDFFALLDSEHGDGT
jgi:hypothetical protein